MAAIPIRCKTHSFCSGIMFHKGIGIYACKMWGDWLDMQVVSVTEAQLIYLGNALVTNSCDVPIPSTHLYHTMSIGHVQSCTVTLCQMM